MKSSPENLTYKEIIRFIVPPLVIACFSQFLGSTDLIPNDVSLLMVINYSPVILARSDHFGFNVSGVSYTLTRSQPALKRFLTFATAPSGQ